GRRGGAVGGGRGSFLRGGRAPRGAADHEDGSPGGSPSPTTTSRLTTGRSPHPLTSFLNQWTPPGVWVQWKSRSSPRRNPHHDQDDVGDRARPPRRLCERARAGPIPPARPHPAQPRHPPLPPRPAGPHPRRARAGPSDWPTFLGPTQDGVSTERGIIAPWPAEGLRKVWECELGVGLAPPAVADGRLFHFDRFEDNCRLTCRDAATGKFHWQYEFPTDYVDRYGYYPGPRACPLVVGERVYVYGPEGVLACVRVADGKELWKIDTVAKYHIHQNFFGVGSVPLIDGELLIVAI